MTDEESIRARRRGLEQTPRWRFLRRQVLRNGLQALLWGSND